MSRLVGNPQRGQSHRSGIGASAANDGRLSWPFAHQNDTRFAFIEFPLDIHGPGAVMAARASLAARAQPEKFLAFHTLMMGESEQMTEEMVMADAKKAGLDIKKLQADMANPEIGKIIADSHAFGKEIGLQGTPTFIINGATYPGAMDDAAMAAAFKKK